MDSEKHQVAISKTLDHEGMDHWELMLWNNPAEAPLLQVTGTFVECVVQSSNFISEHPEMEVSIELNRVM